MARVRELRLIGTKSAGSRPTRFTSAPGPLALIIDSEAGFRRYLRNALNAHGYRTIEAASDLEGLDLAAHRIPDLVLLNPEGSRTPPVDIAQRLRTQCRAPILVISESRNPANKAALLDAGADDYLEKPLSMPELLARIRVAQRHVAQRGSAAGPRPFESGSLRVDLVNRRVSAGGKAVHLTVIEYRLLSALIERANRVVTHRELLAAIWGPDRDRHVEYLRVYMRSLRQKLETGSDRKRIFVTEPGIGYRLDAESAVPRSLGQDQSTIQSIATQQETQGRNSRLRAKGSRMSVARRELVNSGAST